ncbi:DUF308 domain-containing protein [Streptomyces sp. NPDC093516]|uniref:DUF308 domain-containing protein n=1 Tax=Streptomyces sp. NPDC093516 TaxID=3155304 RepID=UPI003443B7D6
MSTQPLSSTPTGRAGMGERSSLLKLFLIRGILAVAWAVAFSSVQGDKADLGSGAVVLLVAYPLIDAVSSLIDYRATPGGSERRVTAFNGALSTLAAIALALAGAGGLEAAFHVFGVWALVSGIAQVIVGLRRRGPELGKQWPTLISGGLSFLVGITYNIQAAGDNPSLAVLSVYATGGGVWFILQAVLLGWKSRQLRTRTV